VDSDPDPDEFTLILVGWIRIREYKNDPQKMKKVKNFLVLKCWTFYFEGFSCMA
jgi:hypothetical protein